MKKLLALATALSLTGAIVAAGYAAEAAKGGTEKTVKGELIDSACYFGADKKGPGHKKCAAMCVKAGAPMSVLTADGTTYLLVANHSDEKPYEDLKEMAAEQVEVSGKDVSKGGMNVLVVASFKKL